MMGIYLAVFQFFIAPIEAFAAETVIEEGIMEEEISETPDEQENVTVAVIDTVILEPEEMELKISESMVLTATAYSENNEVKDVAFEWNSSAPDIVEADSTGKITAKASGQAIITVCSGEIYDECAVNVVSSADNIEPDAESPETEKEEGSLPMMETWPEDEEGEIAPEWADDHAAVTEADEKGIYTVEETGQVMASEPVLYSGWQEKSGIWYYYDAGGRQTTGWQKVNNIWYYLDGSGAMQTGWQKVNGIWYYLNGSGAMQTGWQKVNGIWYYLNGSGVMQTGWQKMNGIWYYMNGSGAMQTGWQKVNGIWYYMNGRGAMQTGWQKVNNIWYYLNGRGEMQTGWQKVNSIWYYMNGRGEMQTGWQKVKSIWYYMNGRGEMQTGWQKVNNIWYYMNGNGAMQTGWQRIDNVWYYFDSSGAMRENGGGTPVFGEEDIFRMSECEIESVSGTRIRISLGASRNSTMEGLSHTFYIVMMDSSGTKVLEAAEGNISKGSVFQISAEFSANDSFKTVSMGKYGIAVKQENSYQVISNLMFLSNPDALASKEEDFKDKYWGYYEGYKITSKKGIQGASAAYTEDLRVQQVLLNVDIQDLVWTRPASGYVSYSYKGKTYYFSDLVALKKTVYDLQGWGSTEGNAYGMGHSRSTTMVLLMSWKYDELSYLIHPDARNKGAAPYYTLNMQEEHARETFEALFCYLGENFGERKTRVYNWTLGNEVNSCNAWNYAGNMPLTEYVENYAQAFQLLNQGIRRTAGSPRIFISLDHCWNTAEAGYCGKEFLDEFASCMNLTAPAMQWNVNYHPYSQPLYNTAFWQDYSSTTDSAGTAYISMRNIKVLTDYLSALETKYGKASNSIRVILGEVGYSAVGGSVQEEQLQAAALGYGYYIAMFNRRIDAYIIRAYLDAPEEVNAGLYLGLRRNDYPQTEKQSYTLYRDLDTGESLKRMEVYLSLIGISGWQSAIPGFDARLLPAEDF